MFPSQLEFLRHILDECEFILRLTKEHSKENIIGDATLCRALARSLEIIGEATGRVEDDLKIKYSHLKWKDMKNMRNRLIHDYFGTDYEIVCDTGFKRYSRPPSRDKTHYRDRKQKIVFPYYSKTGTNWGTHL